MIAGWIVGFIFWFSVGGILYVYLGYPLLATLLARLRPKPAPYPPAAPSVTLLVAAYNEEELIAQKIENCLALDYPGDCLQILVAADGSTDRTAEIVRGYASRGVELNYAPPRRGKMAAINRAMSVVRHEILVFSDANNMYQKDTLCELVGPFADPSVGAVSGAKHILKGDGALGESEGLYWKYESFVKKQETRLGTCTGVSGEILALRRSLFRPCPDGIINDDFSMALEVVHQGYRVVYAPQARSFERVSPTAKDEIARRTRIIAGRYQVMANALHSLPWKRPLVVWQVISHKFLRPLVPFWMILALLANLAALAVSPPDGMQANALLSWLFLAAPVNWIFLILQLDFYLTAWAGNRLQGQKGIGKLLYLPAFLVNSNAAALFGLFRYLTGKQVAAWQRVARRKSDRLE
jgi:cellulose synthase/poly-beta-1,6-N-acetylglucosamine synthase-like glycosyltransferase